MPGLWLDLFDDPRAAPAPTGAGTAAWQGGRVDRASRTREPGSTWALALTARPVPERREPAARSAGAGPDWDLEEILADDRPAPEGAGGLILVSMDVDPAVEDEFNDWYDTEHVPLLRRVEGVLRARRFRALRGAPRYVALYEVDRTERYASEAWRAANETPWMLRMRRFQRNRTYFMFDRRIAAAGRAGRRAPA